MIPVLLVLSLGCFGSFACDHTHLCPYVRSRLSYLNTMSAWDTDEQMPEAGAETRAHDAQAGLGHQDRDDKKVGAQECRCADFSEEEEVKEVKQDVVDEEVEHEEQRQETQKGTDRKEEEEEEEESVDEEAKAKENEPAKVHTVAENQDEDHEEVVHDHQQQQAQKEQDREKNEEDVVADATESDAELVKWVTENADAKAHQHEEPEGAEQPVTKRDRTLKENTSSGPEPPKKASKSCLLTPESGPELVLVHPGAASAAGLLMSPATGHAEGQGRRLWPGGGPSASCCAGGTCSTPCRLQLAHRGGHDITAAYQKSHGMSSETLADHMSGYAEPAKRITWIAVQRGKDGMDGCALGMDGKDAKNLSDAFGHRLKLQDLQGKGVGDVVTQHCTRGLYEPHIIKRYTIVYIPRQQGEMVEVHYSFWHQRGDCQFIPFEWNGSCQCYQQVNPTFDMSYE